MSQEYYESLEPLEREEKKELEQPFEHPKERDVVFIDKPCRLCNKAVSVQEDKFYVYCDECIIKLRR